MDSFLHKGADEHFVRQRKGFLLFASWVLVVLCPSLPRWARCHLCRAASEAAESGDAGLSLLLVNFIVFWAAERDVEPDSGERRGRRRGGGPLLRRNIDGLGEVGVLICTLAPVCFFFNADA